MQRAPAQAHQLGEGEQGAEVPPSKGAGARARAREKAFQHCSTNCAQHPAHCWGGPVVEPPSDRRIHGNPCRCLVEYGEGRELRGAPAQGRQASSRECREKSLAAVAPGSAVNEANSSFGQLDGCQFAVDMYNAWCHCRHRAGAGTVQPSKSTRPSTTAPQAPNKSSAAPSNQPTKQTEPASAGKPPARRRPKLQARISAGTHKMEFRNVLRVKVALICDAEGPRRRG